MAQPQYPLINGHAYSYSSIELDLGTVGIITGITEVNYSHELDPGEVRGLRPEALGTTRGTYSAEGSLTFLFAEWKRLLDVFGDGYLEKRFTITVTYAEEGSPTVTDRLFGCRLKKPEKGYSEGNDALTVSCDIHVMRIEENGKTPLKNMLR